MEEVARLAEEATGGHRFTPVVVSKYVNEAIEKWRVQKDAMMENHKAIELQKINRLETEYWNAWEVSRQIMKSKSTIKNKDSEGGKLKVATVRDDEKPSAGDAQFLRGIQWCIDKRCLILGIEVPQLQPPAGPVTTNNNITYIRRVVFKTRETTSAPQVIEQPTNSEE